MGLWETVVGTVIGGAILGMIGWSIPRVYDFITKRPDWIARRDADGTITVTRSRRKTAFDVGGGIRRPGFIDSDPFQLYSPMPLDVRRGDSVNMRPDAGEMQYMYLAWIDGERLAADAPLPTPDKPVPIRAKRSRKRLRLTRS